ALPLCIRGPHEKEIAMNPTLKLHLIENFGLDKGASDEDAQKLASAKLLSKELTVEKYTELLAAKGADQKSAQEKLAELLEQNSKATATAVVEGLTPVLSELAKSLQARAEPPKGTKGADPEEPEPPQAPEDMRKELAEMEKPRMEKCAKEHGGKVLGGDGAALMKMAAESDDDPDTIRVKSVVDAYEHTPTALKYKKPRSKLLGLDGQPMQYNGKDVNQPTQRTKFLSAVWLKFQVYPEALTERETDAVRWILHCEKFNMHSSNHDNSGARCLTG